MTFFYGPLHGHLLPISQTIQARRTRQEGHSWRSKDKLISDVLLWTPPYGRASVSRLARTYLHPLCEDTKCSLEDLPGVMDDREGWRERERVSAVSVILCWWWWHQNFNDQSACTNFTIHFSIKLSISKRRNLSTKIMAAKFKRCLCP